MADATVPATLSPNPLTPATTLRFAMPTPGPVRINLSDVAGRQLRDTYAGDLPTGQHAVPLTLDRLAAGVYVVSLVRSGHAEAFQLLVTDQ